MSHAPPRAWRGTDPRAPHAQSRAVHADGVSWRRQEYSWNIPSELTASVNDVS